MTGEVSGKNSNKFLMSLVHQNVQSLGNSVDKLQYFLDENRTCKFLCITEHWKSEEQLQQLKVNNFTLAAKYCRQEGKHGGAAIYIHNSINFKTRKKLNELSVAGEFECAAAECTINKLTFIIIAIYRPCIGNVNIFFDKLEQLLNIIFTEDKTILMGVIST